MQWVGLLLGIGGATLTAAQAQEAMVGSIAVPVETPADTAAAREPESAAGPDEVVVTAQKRRQSLQDVPVSVGVVAGDQLAQGGNFDAAALQKYLPNVQIDIDPQSPVVGIRGYDTETDNVGFEPAVGLVFDELALGRAEFIPDGLFDVDRIEVLRGPQGTLFGKNTIAGVISFRSAEVDDERHASLSLTGGDPEQRRAEASANLPLGSDYGARLAGVYWDREGDLYNSTLARHENTLDQRALRLKLEGHPADGLKVNLSGQYSNLHVSYAPYQLDAADPAALRYAQRFDTSTEDNPLDAHTAFDTPGYVDRSSHLERALVEDEIGDVGALRDVTLTAVLGHAAFDLRALVDADVSAANLVFSQYRAGFAQNSIELRPSGKADSLFGLGHGIDWTLGIYAFQSSLSNHFDAFAGDNLVDFARSDAGLQALGAPDLGALGMVLDALPSGPAVPINDALLRGFRQSTHSYALFGQMNWLLTDALTAIVGARFGLDDKHASFDVQRVGPGFVALVVGATPFSDRLKRRESDVSPKLGLQYQWQPELMTFATYTAGFKGGGFNATAAQDARLQFEPEKASSYELGFKSRWWDRRLTLNGTLYRTNITNLQTVAFNGITYQTANAAKARLQGVELETLWRPRLRGFSLAGGVAVSRAYYLRYPNAPASAEDSSGSSTQDLSGRTLAHAPNITATLSPQLQYALLWPLSELRLGVDFSFRGHQYSAVDLDTHSYQGGYLLVGAHAALGNEDDRWSLTLSGNNLSNRRTRELVYNNSVYQHTYVAQQNALRSVSATLKLNF